MKNYKNILLVFLLVILSVQLQAEGDEKNKPTKLYKTNGQPEYAKFNINNISTWIFNNGESDKNISGNSGFVYPIGTNKTSIYKSGLVWGGKINGEIRVGGSTYRTGIKPGRILEDGTSEDINLPHVRIYRVRRDYKTAELTAEAEDESKSINEIYNQYEKDWNEWPAEFGAPFEDVDNDRNYNSQTDIPGIPGADQTIWYVANDLDKEQAEFLYGSLPIGLEIQVTIWGYQNNDILSNTMFRKYILINKSGNPVDEMYVSMWSDPDVGDATDDYVGIDTTLSLAYAYNGDDYDATYGEQVPAVGFKLLQGPLVNGNNNEKGISNGRIITGKKNLDYTAFGFFVGGDPVFGDPNLGEYAEGTLEFYNLMQGKIGSTGQYFTDPNTGKSTKFCLFGDPLKKEGWIDGQLHPPGDRRIVASSGPFEMAVGDTQEIIIAQIAAVGTNRMESIKYLRFYSARINDLENVQSLKAPLAQNLTASEFTPLKKIKLEWDDINKIKEIENFAEEGYVFQGYNLYQINSDLPIQTAGKKIISFDKIDGIKEISGIVMDTSDGRPINGIVQHGTDSGIKREIILDKDYFINEPFIKGKSYYFGLTYYLVNPQLEANESIIESNMNVLVVKHYYEYPGANYGDTIFVKQTKGISSPGIEVLVDNPEELKKAKYEITFDSLNGELVWNLKNTNENYFLATNNKLYDPDLFRHNRSDLKEFLNFDGFKIFLSYEQDGLFENGIVEVAYGGENLPESGYDSLGSKWGGNKVWHDPNWEGVNKNRDRYYISSYINGFFDSIKRHANYQKGNDYELVFSNKQDNYGVYAFSEDKIAIVPFELWNIGFQTPEDKSDDYRMIPLLNENSATSAAWGWGTGIDSALKYPSSDAIYWLDPLDKTPGEKGYSAFAETCRKSGGAGQTYDYKYDLFPADGNYNADFHGGFVYPIGRMTICDYDKDGNPPPAGTKIRLLTSRPTSTNDVFEFETENVVIKTIPDEIFVSQNYPNPFNPLTKIQFVIPENGFVKLSVFDLLGQKIKDLLNREMEAGKYEVSFNASNYASGIYVYRLELNNKLSEVKKMVLLK